MKQVLMLLVLAAVGCGDSSKGPRVYVPSPHESATQKEASKLTAENVLKIKEGMSDDDVRLILGPPTKVDKWPDSTDQHWRYKEGEKSVFIVFKNYKVFSKSHKNIN